MQLTRKEMLKLGVLGSAALMFPLERTVSTKLAIRNRIPESQLLRPFTVPFATPPILRPVRKGAAASYQLTMKAAQVQILPGFPKTAIYGYNGITPGPTIVVRRGHPTVVRQINKLPRVSPFNTPSTTSVHLHGMPSLPQYDGYANDTTSPGEYKDYHYPNDHEACTFWYHDHGVHHTSQNVYMGLAAYYIIHDELEESLPIPKGYGRYDVPLIIRDAIFTNSGQLVFDDQGHSSLFGDVILVNGRPWPVMKVEKRKYRFRILNVSPSRSYRLALDSGEPFTFIGTDDGLMPFPQEAQSFRIGTAERYEVVIDFANYRIGERVILRNLQLENNEEFDSTRNLMAFDVADKATDLSNNSVPEAPDPDNEVMKLQESQAVRTREFVFEREHGEFTINGHTWEDVISSGFKFTLANPALGDVEIWRLTNKSGGWFHPVHIHLVDHKMLDRNGQSPFPYELGPKDTFYVGENETVRVIARHGPHKGRYMMHCHNLVHECHSMMGQFEVGSGGDSPFSAPARPISRMKPL